MSVLNFKEQGITIGTTTVYRNLEKMVEQGLVAKVQCGRDEQCLLLNTLGQRNTVIRLSVFTVNARNVEN